MSGGVPGALETLRRLRQDLAAARSGLSERADPGADLLLAAADDASRAREELKGIMDSASLEELREEDRAAIIRLAQEVRAQIAVVGQLASGSARYASLVRELDGSARTKQTYGPGGAKKTIPAPGSIERKV